MTVSPYWNTTRIAIVRGNQKVRRLLLCVLALMLLVTTGCATKQKPGFQSPEDAARTYLEGLRDADFDRMVSTFAGDKAKIISEILQQYAVLFSMESGYYLPQNPQDIRDGRAAKDFITQISKEQNAPKLSTLNVLGFIPLAKFSDFSPVLGGLKLPDSYFGEGAIDLLAKRAKENGADSIAGCIAAFELNENVYLLVLDEYQYGDKWLIRQFGGFLASFMYLYAGWMGLVPLSVGGTDAGFEEDTFREMIASME